MNKKIFSILKYIGCFAALIIVYMILIIATNKIPSSALEENIKKSAVVLREEDDIDTISIGYKKEMIFSFSDSLMLNMAYSVDSNHPIDSMFLSRKDYIPGVTKIENTEATVNIGTDQRFVNPQTGDVSHAKELYHFINEKDMEESFEYARYWHGYMVFLRPLLTIFNITQIRIFFMILLVCLSVVVLYLIYKRINTITAIIFLLGLLGCSIFIVGKSISEIPVFLITLISSIVLLLRKDIKKNIGIIFFIIGSVTAFADLLTAPLIAMLIPVTIYLLLIQKDKKLTEKEALKKYIFLCVIWIIGYIATWGSKWIILDLIYNRDIFKQALLQIGVRSVGNSNITYGKTLAKILAFLSKFSLYVLWLIPMAIISIVGAIRYKKNKDDKSICIVPFAINTVAPFVWYLLVKNHSYLHPFFAYKILMISMINSMIILASVFRIFKYNKSKDVG